MSEYASILYFVIAGAVLVIYALYKKNYDIACFLVFVALVSIALAIFLYPGYLFGFVVGHGEEALQKLISATFKNTIIKPLVFLLKMLIRHLYYPAVIGVTFTAAVYCAVNRRRLHSTMLSCVFIFLCGILWAVSTVIFLQRYVLRHILASFPLLCLAFPIVATSLANTRHLLLGRFTLPRSFMATVTALYILAIPGEFLAVTAEYSIEDVKSYQPAVEYLYPFQRAQYECLKHPDVPIVLVTAKPGMWTYAALVQFFNDEQIIHFTDGPKDSKAVDNFLQSQPFDDYFLLIMPLRWYNDTCPFDITTFHKTGAYWYEKRIKKHS